LNAQVESRELSLAAADNARLGVFAGPMEQNLRHVEERLGVEVRRRGHKLLVLGPPGIVDSALAVLTRMFELSATEPMSPERVHLCVQELGFPAPGQPSAAGDEVVVRTQRGGIRGRGDNQRQYLDHIRASDLTFGIGPAGTGKTYLAVASAVEALQAGDVRRIVLVRPAVEAGERLGFLPGDLAQKIDPYLRPLYDALRDMLDPDSIPRLLTSGTIEVAPLAYMRGRTLNDAFVILDEAQNTSPDQMKMFLTRLGFGSTMVVTGDVTQVDLPSGTESGLKVVQRILADVRDVSFCHLNAHDVVRHSLVTDIVQAYGRFDETQRQSGESRPRPSTRRR
jgi:phosphate starvation-inducible PhoH-like protein